MRIAIGLLILLPAALLACSPSAAKPYKSKIGIHLLVGYSAGAKKIVQSNCPIIKLVDVTPNMMSALADYRAKNPKGIVVLRIYTPTGYRSSDSPEESAKDYWQKWLKPSLSRLTDQQKKWIDYLEGPNESDNTPTWGTVEDAKWFNRFWLALAPIMSENGFRPCIGSISVGNPPGPPPEVEAKIREFIPAIRLAKKLKGGWCYHPYTIKYTKDPAVEIYYSLRYRRYYDIFRKYAPDLVDTPLLLTEGGVDNDGTFKISGWTRDTPEKFQDWLKWYDKEIARDSYVKGVTLFQIGHPEGWGQFDLEPIADWLAGYLGQ